MSPALNFWCMIHCFVYLCDWGDKTFLLHSMALGMCVKIIRIDITDNSKADLNFTSEDELKITEIDWEVFFVTNVVGWGVNATMLINQGCYSTLWPSAWKTKFDVCNQSVFSDSSLKKICPSASWASLALSACCQSSQLPPSLSIEFQEQKVTSSRGTFRCWRLSCLYHIFRRVVDEQQQEWRWLVYYTKNEIKCASGVTQAAFSTSDPQLLLHNRLLSRLYRVSMAMCLVSMAMALLTRAEATRALHAYTRRSRDEKLSLAAAGEKGREGLTVMTTWWAAGERLHLSSDAVFVARRPKVLNMSRVRRCL